MEVTLLPVNEKEVIDKLYLACRTCYNAGTPNNMYKLLLEEQYAGIDRKDAKLKLLKHVINSGHHSTLEHQQLTFLISGVSRACYDDQTEVLTREGWKLFRDVTEQDKIATRNSLGHVEWQSPTNFIQYPFNGAIHKYKSEGVDLLVTPNHNLFIKKYDVRTPSKFHLEASEDVKVNRFKMTKNIVVDEMTSSQVEIKGYSYQRKNNQGEYYTVDVPSKVFSKDVFIKFLAIYLSDGSVYYNKKENSYTISITQASQSYKGTEINENTRKEIIEVMKALGLTPVTEANCIKCKSLLLGHYFNQLGTSTEKRVPFEIFTFFNKEYANIFIDTYAKYDGTEYKGHKFLFTTSKQLKDDIQLIASIAGYASSIYIDDRVEQSRKLLGHTIVHNFVCYRVSLSNRRNLEPMVKRDKHFSLQEYNGIVYCLEVPNHVIMVRRNGLMVWCGNCTHQLIRHRICNISQQSQRYVEFKDGIFEYVTPSKIKNNEEALKVFEDTMGTLSEAYKKLVDLGLPAEDARAVLPNACATNLTWSCNLRELMHVCNERLCTCAQQEIRQLVTEIKNATIKQLPFMKPYLVSKCEMLGYCNENPKRSCGRKYTKDVVFGSLEVYN